MHETYCPLQITEPLHWRECGGCGLHPEHPQGTVPSTLRASPSIPGADSGHSLTWEHPGQGVCIRQETGLGFSLRQALLLGGAVPTGTPTLACPWGLSVLVTLAFPQSALSACFFPTRPHGNYKDPGGEERAVVHESWGFRAQGKPLDRLRSHVALPRSNQGRGGQLVEAASVSPSVL